MRHRGSLPGAFKLDHLQPVELILAQNYSTFLNFILGLPFLITPERGRKEAARAENIVVEGSDGGSIRSFILFCGVE